MKAALNQGGKIIKLNKQIEILAPVGSMESLYAAIQNGANAVYLGGKLFNARHYASNFDFDQLKEAVSYAHLRGVKVYVTVNILIDNEEIEAVIDYIRYLYQIDIDGIIIQDLGLASLLRKIFPDLDLHGSTQMTINNLPGSEFLQDMGFTRLVLARETPIGEIKHIHSNSKIELEAFIHGALCVSYSGQCLMSSMIGGRSGNRGMCAQPCRMPYSIVDKEGVLMENWDKKYLLSTRDLNTLDEIGELVDSGIISLKIEGRMKRPEYVATVVKNYRKALDQGSSSLSQEDKKEVKQIFNRGFTKGLTFGDFSKDFITLDRPDNRGLLAGKVTRIDKYKVYVLLEEDIEKGDGLEFETTRGEYKGILAPYGGKKGKTLVLEKPAIIKNDSSVYKTSSLNLLNKARESFATDKIKKKINLKIEIKIGYPPILIAELEDKRIQVGLDQVTERGEKVHLKREKVYEQISRLGDTIYELESLAIDLDEEAYLPVSSLNQLRRLMTEKLDFYYSYINKREDISDQVFLERKSQVLGQRQGKNQKDKKISIKVSNINQFWQLDLNKLDRIYIGFYQGLKEVLEELKAYNKEVYIYTDKILYQKDLDYIRDAIKPYVELIDGISVSNIGSLKFFKDNFDLKIHSDIGLNAFNSHTVNYLMESGSSSVCLSPELNLKQIKNLMDKADGPSEAIVYGYLALMVTKHCPMALVKGCKDDSGCKTCNFSHGYGLKDRMGVSFYMDRKEGFSNIYNSLPLMVVDNLQQIYKAGINYARLDFTIEKEKIREIQSIYYDYAKDLIDKDQVKDYLDRFKEENKITNGHVYRGIL